MAQIPAGISIFHYNGANLDISAQPWKDKVAGLYDTNLSKNGWVVYKPTSGFPSLTQILDGKHYWVNALEPFDFPGASLEGTDAELEIIPFDDTPTQNSTNAVTSGGVWTWVKAQIAALFTQNNTWYGTNEFTGDLYTKKKAYIDGGLFLGDEDIYNVFAVKTSNPAGVYFSTSPAKNPAVTAITGGNRFAETAAVINNGGTSVNIAALSIDVPNATTGNKRKDITVARYSGGTGGYERIAGTEGTGTVVAPAVPAGTLFVRQIDVTDGGSSAGGTPTDPTQVETRVSTLEGYTGVSATRSEPGNGALTGINMATRFIKKWTAAGTNQAINPTAITNARVGRRVRLSIDSKNTLDTLSGWLVADGATTATVNGVANTPITVDQVGPATQLVGGRRNEIDIFQIDDTRFEVLIDPKP